MSMEGRPRTFASHDWGEHADNHRRVVGVVDALRAKGIDVWLDETHMKGNLLDAMCRGIDESHCVLVFVTNNYIRKVQKGGDHDNVRREFMYSTTVQKPMIVIRFDTNLPSKWPGPVGMVLGSQLYVDMSTTVSAAAIESLADMIRNASRAPFQWSRASARAVLHTRVLGRLAPPPWHRPAPATSRPPPPLPPTVATVGMAIAPSAAPQRNLRGRVDAVSDALALGPTSHMGDVLNRAVDTLCLRSERGDPPGRFVRQLERVEAHLGM